jgi:hypothetical protein
MGEWLRISILQHASVELDNTVLRSIGQGRSGTGEEERHPVAASPSSWRRDAMVRHL